MEAFMANIGIILLGIALAANLVLFISRDIKKNQKFYFITRLITIVCLAATIIIYLVK